MKHHHSDCQCEHQLQSQIESIPQIIYDQLPPHIQRASHEEQVNYVFEQTRKRQKEKEEQSHLRSLYLELIEKKYKPLHPQLLDMKNWEIDKTLQRTCSQGSKEEMLKLLNYVGQGIYTFNFLSSNTCELLISEVEHFEKWCIQYNVAPQRPNTMNNYGAILDDLGFAGVLHDIMINIVEPYSKILYPFIGDLDDHHGFIVEYQIGKDVKLDFHVCYVDDSEVTLNVCLGKQFKEGSLYFGGVRCALHQQTKPEKDEEILVSHQPGVALLHLGKHRHAAQKITSGHRINLILWCRSSSTEKGYVECPEWCYYHSI